MPQSDLTSQKTSFLIVLSLWFFSGAPSASAWQSAGNEQSGTRPHVTSAFVVDDRLSVLRRSPDLRATVVRRLHLGRKVWIVAERPERKGEPTFYRVAVSRRTSGWIHATALSVPGRRGQDQRVMRLINVSDGFDRVTLCRLFIDNFPRSPLLPQALFELGAEAERAAQALTLRSNRRLSRLDAEKSEANLREYYLSDPGLDRYSKIGIAFDFDVDNGEYVYDGKAYRQILARHPRSEPAEQARTRLQTIERKLGRAP